jgi:zinc protease
MSKFFRPRRSKSLASFRGLMALGLVWFTLSAPGGNSRTQAQSADSESWRKQAPIPQPIRPLQPPPAHTTRLENGLTVVTVADHRAPLATIEIALPVGTVDDPSPDPGLATATAELVTEGSAGRSSEELAREIERLGAQLGATVDRDYTELSVSVLAENANRLLDITAEVLLKPDFPESEVELYKSNAVENLAYRRQDPAFLESEYFNKFLYGSHPYSVLSPTPKSIDSLSKEKLEDFYKSHYGPEGAILVLVGDFDPAAIEARAKLAFGQWRGPAGDQLAAAFQKQYPPPPAGAPRRIYLIDRPGSDQADIRIGNLAAARGSGDLVPLLVANAILGGGTSSRLFLNIREQKGYTYDISSTVTPLKQLGAFFGRTETRNEVVLPTIKEMLAEFARIRNETVSEADLQHAKNNLSGAFALSLSIQSGLADEIVYAHIFGLGPDYLTRFFGRLNSVTAEQVQQAARNYIFTDRPLIIVVGDAAILKSSLESIGSVQTIELPEAK